MPDQPADQTTTSTPTASSPAASIIEQYELGDDSPSSPAAAPVPAEPAPESDAPARDRDEQGRYAKKPTDRLVAIAREFGIDGADQLDPDELREEIRDARLERRLRAMEERREARPAPEPEPASDLDPEQYDPAIIQKFAAYEKRIKQLEALTGQLVNHTRAKETESVAERIDRAFASHAGHLGTKRGIELQDSDPLYQRRLAVLALVEKMPDKGTLEAKIDRAVTAIYGESPKPSPQTKTKSRVSEEEWDAAGLARPTNRSGSPEAPGRSRAVKSVAKIVSEIDSANGTADADGDEFLS